MDWARLSSRRLPFLSIVASNCHNHFLDWYEEASPPKWINDRPSGIPPVAISKQRYQNVSKAFDLKVWLYLHNLD